MGGRGLTRARKLLKTVLKSSPKVGGGIHYTQNAKIPFTLLKSLLKIKEFFLRYEDGRQNFADNAVDFFKNSFWRLVFEM